jgi:hypothetical protein
MVHRETLEIGDDGFPMAHVSPLSGDLFLLANIGREN